MEQLKKTQESAISRIKTAMADEIEEMTMHFSNASQDLVKLTREHRDLQKKFDEYSKKSEKLHKDKDEQIAQLEKDLA